ncbi:iron-sulfur cluster assembly scaffold protein [Patescibacteria group bacterium]|nr:iron-sulfur cluster assembly scaffold protein [Patescibacteria group bacterium]
MTIKTKKGDVGEWLYSKKVKQHFFNPVKFMKESEEKKFKADGIGQVGSSACGDVMKFWIKVDKSGKKIIDCRWRTYGCGSAIASTSVLAEMLTEKGGMTIEKALKIKPQDISNRLDGLPAIKVHCSVLGDQALRKAIEDYKKSSK